MSVSARCFAHLLFHAVPCVYVFNVIQEVTDWIHVAEMMAVLVDGLQHLVESHTNLTHKHTSLQ